MTSIDSSTDAVTQLVRDEYVRLVRAVAVACGSMPAAEDAVQEALARAWDRSQHGQEFDHLAGWVVTVAMNLVRSGSRRVGRHRRLVERLGLEASSVGSARRAESAPSSQSSETIDLRRAIDRLPRRQREVVLLHYYLDFDVATIAASLGVSAGTVKTALFRARASLAAALGETEVTRHG